jgi:hypothetical protein
MCVLLCANVSVHGWFDLPSALSERQLVQIVGVNTATPIVMGDSSLSQATGEGPISLVTSPAIIKRSAWIQAYCRRVASRRTNPRRSRLSQQARHNPLEALANAWGRLLVLVGWRA